MATHHLLVSFTTRLVPGCIPDAKDFAYPANYKDPAIIAKWYEKKAAELAEECLLQPYTATFDSVSILDPDRQDVATWVYRDPAEKKYPVSVAVRDWLISGNKDVWSMSLAKEPQADRVVFIGFDASLFLDIMGIECALPEVQLNSSPDGALHTKAAPLSMWKRNPDVVDIESIIKPDKYKALTWPMVLRRLGLVDLAADWQMPHKDIKKDADLLRAIARRLGIVKGS